MVMLPFLRHRRYFLSALWKVTLGAYLLTLVLLYLAKTPVVADSPKAVGTDLLITTFNTEYWHIPERELVDQVHYQDMDLVFFQEHLEKIGDTWRPTNRIVQLKSVLKDRFIGWNGEVVTVSKWPIVKSRAFMGGLALRTDVLGPGGRIISAYNVHLPVHLHLDLIANPWRFYKDAQATAVRRQHLLDELHADLSGNSNPVIVAGDFNSTVAMNGAAWFRKHLRDAYTAPHCPDARDTFSMNKLLTWRIDYVFISTHFQPYSYCTQAIPNISDHSAITAGLSLPAPQISTNRVFKSKL